MLRWGQVDLPAKLSPTVPLWLGQLICALAIVALVALVRVGIDRLVPGAAPFILLSPGVLLATLIAGWRAGVLALAGILYLAWRHVLLPAGLDFSQAAHVVTLVLNGASALLVVLVAEGFRRLARQALAERTGQLTQRDLLYRELDHRVKNTLAMIASIVELERKRSNAPEAQQVLGDITARIESIAHAHRNLYRGDNVASVDLGAYLIGLCGHMSSALHADKAQLICTADPVLVDRDRALSFGLVVNELATNAAKHNSDAKTPILVTVRLSRDGDGWLLTVSDNGPGLPTDYSERPGLGRRLVEAFARQADAVLSVRNAGGACYELRFRA